ncbi:DNA-binding protein HU [Acaryochloris thomasi RCC1774]|uniref:DNA-binding protein HU n=1 Tax=Acaryochloris thomasi RCC1774 TaxID=1764569 RepID=A0A2W1J7U8_9CYAN|nr:HU family DNA-binding protein [Acaryochloris thomasi]PZD70523.1 DNA-binding protein HU [Acaryochloris thomasi RCC1774]
MNKAELVDEIEDKSNVTKKQAEDILTSTTIVEILDGSDKVTLMKFRSFAPSDLAAREERNSQTGKKLKIVETIVPGFIAVKAFKEQAKS